MKKSTITLCGAVLLTVAMSGSMAFAKVSASEPGSAGAAVETIGSADSGKVYVSYAQPTIIKREHTVGSGSVSFANASMLQKGAEDPNFSAQFSAAVKEAMRAKAAGTRMTYKQSDKRLVQQRWEHLAVNR